MRKYQIFNILLGFVITSILCSCGNTTKSEESSQVTSITEDITTIAETETTQDTTNPTEVEKVSYTLGESEQNAFNKYKSNTFIATGNNYIVETADNITYRAYFPVEEYGSLEYAFYFSNTVDSTYDRFGQVAHVGLVGGAYTISSAYVYDGGTEVDSEVPEKIPVTFDGGNTSKEVAEGETFWSDSVNLNVEEGHYLVWEWTISGSNIPCTYMSSLTSTTSHNADSSDFKYCDQIPLPQLIGANRDVKLKISAIGDSITQGCQTNFMAYEFWAGRISQKLGSDYSFWNCGLGWSRTSDISQCGNWLARAKQSDIVIVAYGTNDIISGEYGGNGGNTPQEIIDYLKIVLDELKSQGCEVILFNAPPEDYDETLESVRLEYNQMVEDLAKEYDVNFFDFASYLSDEDNPAKAKFGGHPNGEGGEIVANAFIEQFKDILLLDT